MTLTPPSDRKLFLLDAYALIFRAYYAFIKNPRVNSKGFNTSAVFGFTTALLEVLRNERPSHLAVVFDAPGDTFRTAMYPEYKANRDETPEDIRRSVPWIMKLLEALDVPVLMAEGFEADDLIGCVAHRAASEGFDVYMMTPDKDFGQLVTDRVRIYKPAKGGGDAEVWGPAEVCARFDIERPEQVIDLLGLMGDSVDNIPGIPGVGPKTAAEYLKKYGSVEGLIAHAHELKGKARERVEQHADLARLSRELATIRLDVPCDIPYTQMQVGSPHADQVREVMEELEFRTLLQRVNVEFLGQTATATAPVAAAPSASRHGQLGLFDAPPAAAAAPAPEVLPLVAEDPAPSERFLGLNDVPHTYALVDTPATLEALLGTLAAADTVAFDTETSGLDPFSSSLVGMSFATAAGQAWWVPAQTAHWDVHGLIDAVRPILADPGRTLVGHNLKFDLKICALQGLHIGCRLWDTMLAHYLLQPETSHKLDRVAETELGYRPIPIEDLIGPKGKDQQSMADLDPAGLTAYACEDADVAWQLRDRLLPQLESAGALQLLEDVECPLVRVLADMELTGVRLDVQQLAASGEDLAGRVAELTARIYAAAGKEFNLDSPKQLSDILFGHLGLTPNEKPNKTGAYPTGEDVLQKLASQHPIVSEVLRYRKLRKLLSTYIEPLPRMVVPSTGHIHTDYMQAVAATGRLSSTDPNLQNIPIRTEDGRSIRKAFVASDDRHILLAADYSQVELRIAASLSNDPGLVEAFASGHDIHTATAARVFGVAIDAVDRDMRSKAKAVNFGILYGQGAFGLAGVLGISRKEAKAIIDAYFEQFPTLQAFTTACVDRARACGYAETVLGRRRYLPDLQSNNATVRAFAERNAVNAPIQGSAADIIKVAMVRCARRLKEEGFATKMILQVHDELVFDVPRDELARVQPVVRETMEQAVRLQVPLVVDMATGENWLEAHG